MNRILIVDDERLIRSSLSKQVEAISDIHVVSGTAKNGEEALQWLGRYYADMCITDVRMPRMDGLELIRAINNRFPWMSCIVVSSYDDFHYIQKSMQLGAIDYVLKPVNRALLANAVQRSYEKIVNDRYDYASRLLLKRLPHHQDMVERWITQVKTVQYDTMPLLVVDTLDMLEDWIGEDFLYLNALSTAWLNMIGEALKRENLNTAFDEGKDLGLGERTIPLEKRRSYFRLCAVRRLEEGANLFFSTSREQQEQPSRKVVDDVKAYLEEHYAEKITLQELADIADVSRNYIATLFRKTTGETIWNCLVAIRMRKARELLLNTTLKVYEISSRVGYENSVHFSQLFKEYYGLSPAEYKRRMEA